MAGAVLGSVPIVIRYVFFFDDYVSRLTAGAIKWPAASSWPACHLSAYRLHHTFHRCILIVRMSGRIRQTLLSPSPSLKVADEVWIATALLHRENPDREDFTVREIIDRLGEERLAGTVRGSVHVHVVQHCVANRAPNPASYRMLFETGPGKRRLYRPIDPHHPERRGRLVPARPDVPTDYQSLLDWYEMRYVGAVNRRGPDPLLALRGSGRALWANEHADEYVRRLREGWA
jgi:hypothetical protein